MNDPLIEKLIARLKDRNPTTRLNAVGALRLHGARAAEAVEELERLLSDEDPRVRREAAQAVARLRGSAAA